MQGSGGVAVMQVLQRKVGVWSRNASSESNLKSLSHWSQICAQLDNSMNHCYCAYFHVLSPIVLQLVSYYSLYLNGQHTAHDISY
jgi:hypothetical protein